MSKKILLAAFIVLTLAGAVSCAVFSVLGKKTASGDDMIDVFDPGSFKAGCRGSIHVDPENIFETEDGIVTAGFFDAEDNYSEIILEGIDMNRYSAGHFLETRDADGNLVYNVTVRECPDELRLKLYDYYVVLYDSMYERALAKEDIKQEYLDIYAHLVSDEGHAELDAVLSHMMCEVTPVPNYGLMKIISIAVAALGAVCGLCILLSYKFKAKTIVLGFPAVLIAIAGVFVLAVRKQIATVMSLKELKPGVYTLKYTADYKLDNILDSGITNEDELIEWLEQNIYGGLPVAMKDNLFGCSAFLVADENGNHLMGRNTDYPEADCLILYSDPEDGYDSISVVELGIINIGRGEGQVPQTSAMGRLSTLAMPYTLVEGMNEAGFGLSLLELNMDELHQDTDRKDVIYCVAARAVLDRCATVDEAVAMLDQYDIQMLLGASCHFFMADKTGKSVVVEWFDNEMYVTENPCCTNYIISDSTDYYIDPGSDTRYEVLKERLDNCRCTASVDEAMALLKEAGYQNRGQNNIGTEWSCVYDLDNFTVTMCFDYDYDEPVVISRSTFGIK